MSTKLSSPISNQSTQGDPRTSLVRSEDRSPLFHDTSRVDSSSAQSQGYERHSLVRSYQALEIDQEINNNELPDNLDCFQTRLLQCIQSKTSFIVPVAFVGINMFKDAIQSWQALRTNESDDAKSIFAIPSAAILSGGSVTVAMCGLTNYALQQYAEKNKQYIRYNRLSSLGKIAAEVIATGVGVALASAGEEAVSYKVDKTNWNASEKGIVYFGSSFVLGAIEYFIMDTINRIGYALTIPKKSNFTDSVKENFQGKKANWQETRYAALMDAISGGISQLIFMVVMDKLHEANGNSREVEGAAIIASIGVVCNIGMFCVIHIIHDHLKAKEESNNEPPIDVNTHAGDAETYGSTSTIETSAV